MITTLSGYGVGEEGCEGSTKLIWGKMGVSMEMARESANRLEGICHLLFGLSSGTVISGLFKSQRKPVLQSTDSSSISKAPDNAVCLGVHCLTVSRC